MNRSRELHDRAMDIAFLADRARSRGEDAEAQRLYGEALIQEQRAIRELREPVEPTRSVLHRSAAWLALECGDTRLAEKLAAAGLAADPPEDIAEELRDVWEQATFGRHLKLRGVSLTDNEIQMSLSGPGVGWGVAPWATYRRRVDDSVKMLTRITERRADRPFRTQGPPAKDIASLLNPHVSLPRAASYAVTLKLGHGAQLSLDGVLELPDVRDVIDDFLGIVEAVDRADEDRLAHIVPDDLYRRNALALAKNIAPDGEDVRQVGFTAVRSGQTRTVGFRRLRQDVSKPAAPPSAHGRNGEESSADGATEVSGVLLFANAIGDGSHTIKIVDEDGKAHKLIVPPEMMDDIVRPMWNSRVIARGVLRGRQVELKEIDPA